MKNLLSDNELNLLSSPEIFYGTDSIKYELKNQVNKENGVKNKKSLGGFNIIIDYKPCFEQFQNMYGNVIRKELKFPLFERENDDAKENCLILIHGFKSKNQNIYYQLAERFRSREITNLVYTIPFHFERIPENGSYKNFIDRQDFRVTLELFRNTLIELRILVNELKKRGYKKIGCLGFSFGGCCASLLCCLEPKVDYVIPMASLADFNNIIRSKKNSRKIKKAKKPDTELSENPGINMDQLNEYLIRNFTGLISPVSLKPVIDKKNMLFIQGLFDHNASFFNLQKLRKKWGYPRTVFYPCDHFTFFLFNRLNVILTKNFIKKLV